MSDLIRRQDAELILAREMYATSLKAGCDPVSPMDFLPEARAWLSDAPTIGGWIPCSERLPKTNEVVLLCGKYDIFCGYHNTKGKWYSIIGDGWETGMDFPSSNKGDILAWMPLPEPYSIESDGIKEEKR